MRTTIVPAQITTVEDKIAGNLGLSQIMLLITPIFGGSAIFVILPPFFNYASYKVVLISLMALLCGLLAVRIKGKILLFWAITILRYNIRPTFYVFDKNSTHNRELSTAAVEEATKIVPVKPKHVLLPNLSVSDRLNVERVIASPTTNLHFTTTKKGALRVHLTEVTSESLSQTAN
jgi:hypothetical protein